MNKLAPLRSRLADLRRRRAAVRTGLAACGLVVAVVWTLGAFFAVDWLWEPRRSLRVAMLLVGAAAVAWAMRRLVRPILGTRETEIDLALLVERKQGLESDLVAALQFESSAAQTWGSGQLRSAVVDYVADFSRDWDIFQGFSSQQLVRRASVLTATLLAAVAAAGLFPDHARAFLNRLLLGAAHYPTKTQIERVTVNGAVVDWATGKVASSFGKALAFEVAAGGVLPAAGRVELASTQSNSFAGIELLPAAEDTNYSGLLPKLTDSVTCMVRLGDAWTDPIEIQVVPLPVVELVLTATAPEYAQAASTASASASGARQIGVLEGSRVDLTIVSLNKPLAEAHVAIGDDLFRLEPSPGDPEQRHWQLPPAGTPLAAIDGPIRFSVQATDVDGLSLAEPLVGQIRIKADQKPRVAATMITREVLPAARPRLDYEASDDYALAHLRLRCDVLRGHEGLPAPEPIELIPAGALLRAAQLPTKGHYVLDLSPWGLAKGDRLKITLEAVDARGNRPGESATSEPVLLEVTDEAGAMSAILQADQRSAEQLEAITNRQLGIGGSP